MASARGLRKIIRKAILESTKSVNSSEPGTSFQTDFASRLDKIFVDFSAGNSKSSKSVDECGGGGADNDDDEHNITPLMVACDQKCSFALNYLLEQLQAAASSSVKTIKPVLRANVAYWTLGTTAKAAPSMSMSQQQIMNAWGNLEEESSSGNRAAHHVMAAGFTEGVDLIRRIRGFLHDKDGHMDNCIYFLNPTNHNGDTPLMMASVFGHFLTVQRLVERTIQSALIDIEARVGNVINGFELQFHVVVGWNMIRKILGEKNREGLTAFNLACGHGCVEIAKLLLEQVRLRVDSSNNSYHVSIIRANDELGDAPQESKIIKMIPLAQLVHADLTICEKVVNRIVAGKENIRGTKHGGMAEEFDFQYEHACDCLSLVKCELERLAIIAADELCSETKTSSGKEDGDAKKKKKKKKTKKKKSGDNWMHQALDVLEGMVSRNDITTEPCGGLEDKIGFTPSPITIPHDDEKSPTPKSFDAALPTMLSARCLRTSICCAIAPLDQAPKNMKVGSRLDMVFKAFGEGKFTGVKCNDGDSPTPLMVACDKKCLEALNYLLKQVRAASNLTNANSAPMSKKQLIEAWGHPNEPSCSGGNRAAHDAMAVGFIEGIDLLEKISESLEDDPISRLVHSPVSLNVKSDPSSMLAFARVERYLDLFTPNKGGDTPIMMACVYGQSSSLIYFVERMIQFDLMIMPPIEIDIKDRVMKTWNTILKDFIGCKNKQGQTALNLACHHGEVDVVKLLVYQLHVRVESNNTSFQVRIVHADDKGNVLGETSEDASRIHLIKMRPLSQVSYSDLEYCQTKMNAIVADVAALQTMVKKQNRGGKEKEYQEEYERMRECYCIVGNELTRIANETAKELWSSESRSKPVKSKDGKSQKKKKQRSKALQHREQSVACNAANVEMGSQNTALDTDSIAVVDATASEGDDIIVPSHQGATPFSSEDVATRDGNQVSNSGTSDGGRAGEEASEEVEASRTRGGSESASLLDEMHLISEPDFDTQPKSFQQTTSLNSKDEEDAVALLESFLLVHSPHHELEQIGIETASDNLSSKEARYVCESLERMDGDEDEAKDVTPSHCVALLDGTISSTINESELLLDETPLVRPRSESLHRILQSTDLTASKDDEDIAALMESLCIEPSMLLYSLHEMAIEMSPCQLDVIENILMHQLNVTKNAKQIHARLLNK